MNILPSQSSPMNYFLNKVNDWNQSESFFKRHVVTRITLFVAGPAFAFLSATYQAFAFAVKLPITTLKYTIGILPIKYDGKWQMCGNLLPKDFAMTEMFKHALK